MDNKQLTCYNCGCIIDGCDDYEGDNGERICEGCFYDYFYNCDYCGDVVARDDLVTIDGGPEYVCESCANDNYYQCNNCGEHISCHNVWVDRNITICDNCSVNYYVCEDCGDIISCDDAHSINGDNYCDDCAESNRDVINDYGYKPEPIFYGENAARGYYGLELEIDDGYDRQEAARAIQDAGGNCIYLKHDGSLSSDGFEIVTHPMTLDYHMQQMPWSDIIQAARDYDYTSHDAGTCGLHIHASRSLFGDRKATQDLNIAKCILLIDFWWEQCIVPFSRRNYNQLNEWAKKPNACIMASDSEYDAICKARLSGEHDRYKAVNLKNRHTVEFRFFRGTLRRETNKASIQFVDTLIKYVCGVELEDLWDKTWNDVFANTQYSELKDYLKKRKILDNTEEI